jgi:branched-subunit amino acid transport protein
MADWEIWLVIACLLLATIIMRCSFWLLGHHVTLPRRMQEVLRYAPACALAAITVPDLLLNKGQLYLSLGNHPLLAAIGATVFFLLKRDMLLTILVGMLLLTALRTLA